MSFHSRQSFRKYPGFYFICLLLISPAVMGHRVENGIGYWASTYIEKAIDEGYVIPQQDTRISYKTKDDPYAGYKMPISREYMAQ
ncbi:MAG: hypothetical protein GXZ01_09715, partial [Clostridiaceae bacterium]|nr:hypothetical protein [Clostridiaceae bacterium]